MNKISRNVHDYIENTPKDVQPKLKQIRAVIREVVPDAIESISYGMPFYSFKGESGFGARLCYFGLLKSAKKIAFYTRPAFLEGLTDDVKMHLTSKSTLQFPFDRPIPLQSLKNIVRAGVRIHRAGVED